MNKLILIFGALVFAVIATIVVYPHIGTSVPTAVLPTPTMVTEVPTSLPSPISTASPKPVASSSASASQSAQLSLSDSNKLYGPCAVVPTLMYHHVEDLGQAQTEGHKSLTVGPTFFQSQMQYLKSRNYTPISMAQLIHFFDVGTRLPAKPVLLTFDDAYSDFGSVAMPILNSFGFPATLFVPTGLVENPGYMTWQQITSIGSRVLFANHTWSHHTVAAAKDVVNREVSLADTQLNDHGLDVPKVFSYPYGNSTPYAVSLLSSKGYQLAFTTNHGAILCKGQRLELPRIRIGNAQLSAYGL